MLRGVIFGAVVVAVSIRQGAADDGLEYLLRAAQTYKQLKTLQVETAVARIEDDGYKQSRIDLRMVLYAVRPAKLRIDTKASNNTLRGSFILSGHALTEYRAWANEYLQEETGGVAISFSPERGAGLGEMIYDTIADGVRSASVRGKETLNVGGERMDCIVIDVNYADPLTTFTFWIFAENGVVLQRSVATSSKNKKRTVVSSVTALTLNETIDDAVFQFTPPPGAKLVPSGSSVVAMAQ